ncbi:4Fe-4S dicluster domain-containing protein [uncultured Desulfobacter sp.]|uniref:4Fe-4S dicluster domain-containing protein n=1 Tax=uncultured Desulfobacter sp. TaxID=240139 RepID=UPI002AAA7058|nr:4Fe-4S dicluster domain-containing protein [uncultured Desulfobacter sp.]
MMRRCLKPFRVGIALVFFVPVCAVFLDLWDTGVRLWADNWLFFQFVPSLMAFLNHASPKAWGFIVVLLLTLVFGRVYCAMICPLGIFQDLIFRLFSRRASTGRTKDSTRRFSYAPPKRVLRYGLLALTLFSFLLGSHLVLNLLDPFSSFGRILTNATRPLVTAGNNFLVPVAEMAANPALYRIPWPTVMPWALGVALGTLMTIGWLSARHGRLYCNTICPVGTLLGLVSKRALFKIRMDIASCRTCGLCSRVCRARCIDVKAGRVDTSRCVVCFNCLSACPDQTSLTFTTAWKKNTWDVPEQSRRNFLFAIAAGCLGSVAARLDAAPRDPAVQSRPTTVAEQRTTALTPPGSTGIRQFCSTCTACHLCVAACPSRVLVPALFSHGLSGFMMPRMDFSSGFCNYDCTVCSHVCPSGAILPLTTEKKQRIQVGRAIFIRENCVVHTDNTNCGACSEHCPTKAVHMVPYLTAKGRKLVIPRVDETICVGCGACEHACPTKPFKAIYVDGHSVHKRAETPRVEKKVEKIDMEPGMDFPF